jgi:hypothetical protein
MELTERNNTLRYFRIFKQYTPRASLMPGGVSFVYRFSSPCANGTSAAKFTRIWIAVHTPFASLGFSMAL